MRRNIILTVPAFCTTCVAQNPVILDIDLENETNYLYDVFDYAKVGADPASTAVERGVQELRGVRGRGRHRSDQRETGERCFPVQRVWRKVATNPRRGSSRPT